MYKRQELQPIAKDKAIKLPDILYAFNSADLTEQAKDSLNFLYNTLTDNPTIVIELSSHTDSRGSGPYNKKLSQARAESAVAYLISRGIAGDRMEAKGYGKERLLVTDAEINKLPTEEEREAAHQLNRRTEFTVLSTDYIPKNTEPVVAPDNGEAPVENEDTTAPEGQE